MSATPRHQTAAVGRHGSTVTRTRSFVARALERVLGRRRLVRISRYLLNHARRDGPNEIGENGELLVQRFALEQAGPRAVIFDVGANVGQWSSALLDQCSCPLDLHVFEPSAATFGRLKQTLCSQGPVTIVLNHLAASSTEGSATLFKPHELAGSSSLHPVAGSHLAPETVETTTLDRYCDDRHIDHVDLLKIDAEGHDHHVLLGASGLLARRSIDVVQFEYNHRWIGPRCYLKDVFELVEPSGYRVGKVTPEGIEWYPRWSPELETLIEANFVAALPAVAEGMAAIGWWAEPGTTT